MKLKAWSGIRKHIIDLSVEKVRFVFKKDQRKKSKFNSEKITFVQTEREIWHTYKAKNLLSDTERSRYGVLHNALQEADFFEPVCMNEFVPDISWKKYEYLKGLEVTSKTVRYTYTGGYQNLDFAWRVPNSFDDVSLISSNIKIS